MQSSFGTTPIYINGNGAKSGLLLVSTTTKSSVNMLLTLQHLILLSKLLPIRACLHYISEKMVDIALAIQYKCQLLKNTFSTLNMTEKERFLNCQLFTLCFLELFIFSINSLNVLITKILVFPWQ